MTPTRTLFQRLTLTARLTALYTLVSAAVLLGLGSLTQKAVQSHFDELDQATLRDKVHLMRGLAESSANLGEFTRRLGDVMHSHHGLTVIIRDSDGMVFSVPEALGPHAEAPADWQSVKDTLPLPGQGTPSLTVLAALDPTHHNLNRKSNHLSR